jgi:hypothetical protein
VGSGQGSVTPHRDVGHLALKSAGDVRGMNPRINSFGILFGVLLLVMVPVGCTEKGAFTGGGTESTAPAGSEPMAGSGTDTIAPRVIATFPPNGARDVDPSITELSVTFNEEMHDGGWSWAYKDPLKVPEMPAEPYYTEGNTKNILPVKLEPEKEYVLWINTTQFNYFRDKSGNSAIPYEFRFTTRSAAGPEE